MQKTKFFWRHVFAIFCSNEKQKKPFVSKQRSVAFCACKLFRSYNGLIEIHFDSRSFFGGQRD